MRPNPIPEHDGHDLAGWDTGSREKFFKYYEQSSLEPRTLARFHAIQSTVLRVLGDNGRAQPLDVLDVGCGAGAQSKLWSELDHRYVGVDINGPLIELARQRAQEMQAPPSFEVGTATALPFPDHSFDICLLPELLEHVVDWQGCLDEAGRVLRSGGLLYISTSNKLCPMQEEFNLPFYSWYPRLVQRYFERRAASDWPWLANYAKYPAVHWFSFYRLRDYMTSKGFVCLDRFDLIEVGSKWGLARALVAAIRNVSPLRFLAHMATPYTVVIAIKRVT